MIALSTPDGRTAYVFPEHIVAIVPPIGGAEGTNAELWLVSGERMFVRDTITEVRKKVLSI